MIIPRIPRVGWEEFFMLEAHLKATRSTCDRGPSLFFDPARHGVGAVIVREKRIIAGGYNGAPPDQPHCDELSCTACDWKKPNEDSDVTLEGTKCPNCEQKTIIGGHLIRDGHCVRVLHSECNALLQCALDGTPPAGATLYVTASPCFDCAKMLIRAKIERVVFGEGYSSRYGLSEDVKDILARAGISVWRLSANHLRKALGWVDAADN